MPTTEHKIVKWLELAPESSWSVSMIVKSKLPTIDFKPKHLLGIRGVKAVETVNIIWDVIKDAVQSGNDPDLPLANTLFSDEVVESRIWHTTIAAEPLSNTIKRKDLGQGAEVLVFCNPPGISDPAYRTALDFVIAKANRELGKRDIEQIPLPSGRKAFDIKSILGDLNQDKPQSP